MRIIFFIIIASVLTFGQKETVRRDNLDDSLRALENRVNVKIANTDSIQLNQTFQIDKNGNDIVKIDFSTTGSDYAINGFLYFGNKNTNGTWRIGRMGDYFVIQRRESGLWKTKMKVLK